MQHFGKNCFQPVGKDKESDLELCSLNYHQSPAVTYYWLKGVLDAEIQLLVFVLMEGDT